MATNPYSYGSLGQRWTVGEPTSKSLLDVSRVKADANRWALEQLVVDPDDTANFVLTAPGLNIDSNTLYVDGVNNSVGFGLTNPNDYAFSGTPSWVASGGAGNASVIVVSGTTSIGYLAFADGTTGTDRYSGNIQYNHSTNTMSFRTNGGVEAMTINSAQDIAVGSAGATADFAVWTDGTSSTAAGFTVDASADEVIVGQLSGGGNTNFKVRNRLNNTVFQVTPDAPSTTVFAPNIATGSAGTLTVKTGSINSDSIRLEAGGTASTWLESRGYLGHSWYVDATRSMTLDSTGLGVGTDSPTRLLHLSSTGGTFARFTSENTDDFSVGANANGFVVYNETDADYPFVITNTGNVGIGTNSPSTLLQLNENYGTAALSISDDSSAGDYLTFQIVGGQYNGGANEIQAINTTDLSLNVATARSLIFKTNNTERARILSSGGITFNGDTAAANALNDYEEGTFSIGIEGSTSAGSATISSTAGYYTKIGNVVHAFGFVSWNSATGTGNLKLTGLPFTSSSSSQYYPAGSMTSANLTFSHTITPYVSLGSTFMQIQQSQSGAAGTFVQVDSTAEIYFNVTYFV
jgi:hypothetical protein